MAVIHFKNPVYVVTFEGRVVGVYIVEGDADIRVTKYPGAVKSWVDLGRDMIHFWDNYIE